MKKSCFFSLSALLGVIIIIIVAVMGCNDGVTGLPDYYVQGKVIVCTKGVPDAECSLVDSDGKIVIAKTDDDGYFSLPVRTQGGEYSVKISVEGVEAASVVIIQGKDEVIDLAQLGAEGDSRASIADYICVAFQWYLGYIAAYNYNDKVKHCTASCYAAKYCSLGAGVPVWFIKESIDWACQYAPDWLKNLLRPISACSGWDWNDINANAAGITCIYSNCLSCCAGKF